ncbi:hypothetical protein [Halofilum ochraceum]|uniref:hypothetical protein n=1 Tax=Halofilum ochraceum TaxID=1611323 RepID=UPI0008DACD6F|nr:hypothetical protein [Halofilum ochraceum]
MRIRHLFLPAIHIAFIATALVLMSAAAHASEHGEDNTLNGSEIRSLIAGNTVTGSMSSGQDYAEFYAEDGTIHGRDYTGEWSIQDDKMCFDYGDGATCYEVAADGDTVTWVLDGKADGTGVVREGNPMEM